MIVRKIALNGWRNYEFAAAEFSPGTNVITGENAQGKTNLLEAVYLLTGGKSFRTRFDKELIGFGYTGAEVLADVFAFGREQTVRIVHVSPLTATMPSAMTCLASPPVAVRAANFSSASSLINSVSIVMFSIFPVFQTRITARRVDAPAEPYTQSYHCRRPGRGCTGSSRCSGRR